MQIELKDAKAGDIVLFKGNGPLFAFLSFLLCIWNSKWRRLKWKPWHAGFLAYRDETEWQLCESLASGIALNNLSKYDPHTYKIYRWFDSPPDALRTIGFLETHLGKPYDVAIYFWTAAQYLIRHYWNRSIPRLLDDRYTCWEAVWEFAEYSGKPMCSKYDCPMITDLIDPLELK